MESPTNCPVVPPPHSPKFSSSSSSSASSSDDNAAAASSDRSSSLPDLQALFYGAPQASLSPDEYARRLLAYAHAAGSPSAFYLSLALLRQAQAELGERECAPGRFLSAGAHARRQAVLEAKGVPGRHRAAARVPRQRVQQPCRRARSANH